MAVTTLGPQQTGHVAPHFLPDGRRFLFYVRSAPDTVGWSFVYDVTEKGELIDRLSLCSDETPSSDGYALLWYHSTRKAELDQATRGRQVQRALEELGELRGRLSGRRTRYRRRPAVEQAIEQIISKHEVSRWIIVRIEEQGVVSRPPVQFMAAREAVQSDAPSIAAGQMELRAQGTLTAELK
jgi:hypothetical protein